MAATTEKFADIMHDIRNSVAVVLLCAEYLEKAPSPAEARISVDEAIADMRSSCKNLQAAVERLAKWKEERDG